jgi:hypothetical protein
VIVSVRVALAPLAGPRVTIAGPVKVDVAEEKFERVTLIVTADVPAEVGVPEISPVAVSSDKPSGKPETL